MDNIIVVEKFVQSMLEQYPSTRNSDDELYFITCKNLLAHQGKEIDELKFEDVILHVNELGLPKYETVGRARRKIQQHNPLLRGCKNVEEGRMMQMDAFAEYALEGIGV